MQVPSQGDPNRPPLKKWVTKLYRWLAVGRYAIEWLPELAILVELMLEETGEANMDSWLHRELANSVTPTLTVRVLRTVYAVWKTFRLIWRS